MRDRILRAIAAENSDPAAPGNPAAQESIREAAGLPVELGKAHCGRSTNHCRAIRKTRGSSTQYFG
jgi:hypothetical protein